MKLASASAAILALLGAAAVPAASALEGRRAITTGGRNAIAFPDQVAAAMEVFKDDGKKDKKSDSKEKDSKKEKDDKDKDGKDKKDDKDKDKDKDDKDKDKDKSSKDKSSKDSKSKSSSSSSSSSSKDDKKKKDSRAFEHNMCVDPKGEEEEICDALKEDICKCPISSDYALLCEDVGLGPCLSGEDGVFEAKDDKKDSKKSDKKKKEKKTDDKKKEKKSDDKKDKKKEDKKDDKKDDDDKDDKKKDDKSSKSKDDKSSKDSKSKSSSSSSSSSKDGKKKKTSRYGYTEDMCDEPEGESLQALCDDIYDELCEDPSNNDKDFCEWLGFGSSKDGEVADVESRRKNLRG